MIPTEGSAWTATANRVLGRAAEVARDLRHHLVGPDHLFLALLEERCSRAVGALLLAGISAETAARAVLGYLKRGDDPPARTPSLSPLARLALDRAVSDAAARGRAPDTADLLLALLGIGATPLAQALGRLRCTEVRIRSFLPAVEDEA